MSETKAAMPEGPDKLTSEQLAANNPTEPTPEEIERVGELTNQLASVQKEIDRLTDHLGGAPGNEQYRQELLHYEGVKALIKAELGVE